MNPLGRLNRWFCLITAIAICGQFSCSTTKCVDPELSFSFTGFDSADLSRVHIIAFDKESRLIVHDSIWNLSPQPGEMYSNRRFPVLYKSYEYTATVVSQGKEYQITDFEIKQKKEKGLINRGEADACPNAISFKVNGTAWNVDAADCSGNSLSCWAYFNIIKE